MIPRQDQAPALPTEQRADDREPDGDHEERGEERDRDLPMTGLGGGAAVDVREEHEADDDPCRDEDAGYEGVEVR